MIDTRDDTTSGTVTGAGFSAGRCLWDDTVCVDPPTHFITERHAEGTHAQVFCVRHYVLTLAHICQVHMATCDGPFSGHVADHGEL